VSEGFVKLVNQMVVPGSVSIVNAARQSYGRRIATSTLSPKDIKVIEFMMEHRHGTPFEADAYQFQIRCTIKEARDWFRYRAGSSYNEYSTRFSPRIDDVYIPEGVAIRTGKASGGSPSMEPITDFGAKQVIQREFSLMYGDAEQHYRNLLALGVAQELASMAYPLGQMTEFTWTANVRTLCNFWAQRMDQAAMLELRRKAYTVYSLVEPHIPEVLALWTKYRQPDMYTDWVEGDPWLPEDLR
jgi:thymidylate synthase (FAD)